MESGRREGWHWIFEGELGGVVLGVGRCSDGYKQLQNTQKPGDFLLVLLSPAAAEVGYLLKLL